MKTVLTSLIFALMLSTAAVQAAAPKVQLTDNEKTTTSQWKGKRVAFLGDSMTDPRRVGTTCIYWEYLTELLGITPSVYGISGNQWDGIYKQALKLKAEKGSEVDAILIFAGTNDFSHSTPMGEFFAETLRQTNYNGEQVMRKYRTAIVNDTTFCGRINKVMAYLKENYPTQQIIIMTPIHRGFAQFRATNVQPDENFANGQGRYVESYVETLKQAGAVWAVPVIDLYSLSGLYPMTDAQAIYFANKETDRLHPNALGDYRLAKTIQYQLLSLPAGFETK